MISMIMMSRNTTRHQLSFCCCVCGVIIAAYFAALPVNGLGTFIVSLIIPPNPTKRINFRILLMIPIYMTYHMNTPQTYRILLSMTSRIFFCVITGIFIFPLKNNMRSTATGSAKNITLSILYRRCFSKNDCFIGVIFFSFLYVFPSLLLPNPI